MPHFIEYLYLQTPHRCDHETWTQVSNRIADLSALVLTLAFVIDRFAACTLLPTISIAPRNTPQSKFEYHRLRSRDGGSSTKSDKDGSA